MPASLSHFDQIAQLTNLRHLRIENCENNISATTFVSLPLLENLELLDIPSLMKLTAALVVDMHALRTLRIVRCRNVAPRVLKEIELMCLHVKLCRV